MSSACLAEGVLLESSSGQCVGSMHSCPEWAEEVQSFCHPWRPCRQMAQPQVDEGCTLEWAYTFVWKQKTKLCDHQLLKFRSLLPTVPSSGYGLEMHTIRPHPWPANSENLEMEPRNLCCNKLSRWFWRTLKFAKHCIDILTNPI